MAAPAGLDVRFPLLDRDLVRICEALPGEAKVRDRLLGSGTKWPLRKAMEGRLPADLLHRPKRAPLAPLDHWLRAAGADFLRDRTGPLIAEHEGLFRADELRRLVAEHLSGTAGHGLKLWTVILFDAWRRSLL
jgi:asparagine synthase (glutamine-hydrolysing)